MSEERGEYKAGELLPCPFCGGTDVSGEIITTCNTCGADGLFFTTNGLPTWNTRAASAEAERLRQQLATALAALEEIADLDDGKTIHDWDSGYQEGINHVAEKAADALREMGEV